MRSFNTPKGGNTIGIESKAICYNINGYYIYEKKILMCRLGSLS